MKRIISMVTAGALIATLIVPANVVSTQAKVKKQTISLTVGAVKKLQVNKSFAKKNVKWKSSNKSVVTVNKSGNDNSTAGNTDAGCNADTGYNTAGSTAGNTDTGTNDNTDTVTECGSGYFKGID